MEKFSRKLHGYDPVEVNQLLDQIIKQVEGLVEDINKKDQRILELEQKEQEVEAVKERLNHYKRTEETLQRAILMAQKTSDQMRLQAHKERELLIEDAKKNASRIVNEALIKAERTEQETDQLRRNIQLFKRRLKGIVESQLEVIEDIERVEI